MKHPAWYFIAGSLVVGLLLGIALVFMIQSFRRKCSPRTREVYEDVRLRHELELDVTSQYEDMNRASANYQDVDSSSPYEVAVLRCHAHNNQGRSPNLGMSEAIYLQESGATLTSVYTDLDYRIRADSHLYQGLVPNGFAGDKS